MEDNVVSITEFRDSKCIYPKINLEVVSITRLNRSLREIIVNDVIVVSLEKTKVSIPDEIFNKFADLCVEFVRENLSDIAPVPEE